MKKILLTATLSLTLLIAFSAVVPVYAQSTGSNPPPISGSNPPPITGSNPDGNKLPNPFRCAGEDCNLIGLLKAIVNNILMPIGVVLAVLAFIYAGFKYVMAQGNVNKVAEAHRTLLYTAIGTAILLGAWTIANVIHNTITSIMK
jgi:hypothetical protein